MWRRTTSLPFLWREVTFHQQGSSTGSLHVYQHVRHGGSKTRVNRPRKSLLEPKLFKVGGLPSTSLIIGDIVKARKFQFDVATLKARSFLRFHKSCSPPDKAMEGSRLSAMGNETTLLKKELAVTREKFKLLTEAVETFKHGAPKSVPPSGNKVPITKHRKSSAKTRRPSSSVKAATSDEDEVEEEESFPITAYALCDEFDLKGLHKGLIAQGLYIPTVLSDDLSDVIHVTAKYPIGDEGREIFFFREGAVVFWNFPYLERVNVLKFLQPFQDESYGEEEIEEECEYMHYTRSEQGTRLLRGKVILGDDSTNKILEKYTFANALASSVKLGIWESTLEKYVEGIEHITEALKRAEEIKLSRGEVMQKTGELFALRHQLNLNSDLLDTPDFYWERERLETLYKKTCDYLSIHRRTKVMNEKLSQCCELLDLISSHLTDQHHTRLEWMIIVLIMIEVGFEILHLLERYDLVHI